MANIVRLFVGGARDGVRIAVDENELHFTVSVLPFCPCPPIPQDMDVPCVFETYRFRFLLYYGKVLGFFALESLSYEEAISLLLEGYSKPKINC